MPEMTDHAPGEPRAAEERSAVRPDPRRVTAHISGQAFTGQIVALEGGRGNMRLRLQGNGPWPEPGAECDLEMHDGARFGVTVTEVLGIEENAAEFRMKLADRSS